MKRNKVALVLAFKGTNYGMHLQGYATQQILDSWGYNTEIIDYKVKGVYNGVPIQRGLFTFLWKSFNNRFFKIKKSVNWTNEYSKNNELRLQASDRFRKTMLHDIISVEGIIALRNYAANCDSVLIGSDQLWIPGVGFGNFLSLRFVPDAVNKISYATSLGVSEYPKYCYPSSKKMWSRIEHLSTREEEGKRIINTICPNKQVRVVVDPTYLLTKDEWLDRIPFEKKIEGKYLLCYFLGNQDSSKFCARRYADKHGLKLVSIVSNESMSNIDFSYCDEAIQGASVQDFVNLIRGAECLFTDSFHGLAFGVINEKQFYVFYRRRDDAKQSRNSRIDNILRTWNLSERLITDEDRTWSNDYPIIDYKSVSKTLSVLRAESLGWLRNALLNK